MLGGKTHSAWERGRIMLVLRGASRRCFLRAGAAGCLTLPALLRAAPTTPPRARRCPPPFVSLPEVIKDAAVNEFPGLGAGFLGKAFDPLRIDGGAGSGSFRLPDVDLPPEVTPSRLEDRRLLKTHLDASWRAADR